MPIDEKISFKQKLKKDDLGWRLLVGFIFLICLTMFLHFREVRVDVLDLNATASRYVVAQIDYEFPDDVVTIISKQESLNQIKNIYRINQKEIKQRRLDFDQYLASNPNWKNIISSEDVLNKLADGYENILKDARFTDTQTLRKMKEIHLDTKNYLVFNSYNLVIQKEYLNLFSKRLVLSYEKDSKAALDLVSNYFKQFSYDLAPDHFAYNNVRSRVEDSIPQQYSKVKAGHQIIAQGDIVTQRHLTMIQSMKHALRLQRNLLDPLTILGNFLMAFIFLLLGIFYFQLEQPKIIKSLQKISLIVCITILTLIFAKIIEHILLRSTNNVLEAIHYPIIVPFATFLLSILFNSRISLFVSAFLAIILGVTLAVEHSAFLLVNLVTPIIVIISTRCMCKRKEVFWVAGKCLLGIIPVIIAFSFINNRFWSFSLVANISSSFIFLLIIAILVVGLLPALESLFNVMTDFTLMEYMDPNNELLRRLTLEVPGTYQHSLVLGSLAESAAQSIKANALFCRVATLYHDIGKLSNSNYYTENQQGKGVDIHQLLTPMESAQVIISHVTDGEMLAKKYHLPQPFIDVIKEHHGTTLVYYFYVKEVQLQGGDKSKVDEKMFRYPGPKPRSKESAIIMVTDAVEAASRTLEEFSEQTLNDVVDKIVADRAEDSQFDDCCLTFEELSMIKRTLVKTLLMTRHVRVKYPEKEKKTEE